MPKICYRQKKFNADRTDKIAKHGAESWELDALEPSVIAHLHRNAVVEVRDEECWATSVAEEDKHREQLATVSRRWEDITEQL